MLAKTMLQDVVRTTITRDPSTKQIDTTLTTRAYGMLAIFVMLLLTLTGVRINQIRDGYAIAELEQQQENLVRQKRMLELEIATLKRPERLLRLVQTRLGLAMPNANQVIKLPSSR